MATIQSDMRFAILHLAAAAAYSSSSSSSSPSSLSSSMAVSPTSSVVRSLGPNLIRSRAAVARRARLASFGLRAFSNSDDALGNSAVVKVADKPAVCTADELHYVKVPNSDWRLALWRYRPPPKVT